MNATFCLRRMLAAALLLLTATQAARAQCTSGYGPAVLATSTSSSGTLVVAGTSTNSLLNLNGATYSSPYTQASGLYSANYKPSGGATVFSRGKYVLANTTGATGAGTFPAFGYWPNFTDNAAPAGVGAASKGNCIQVRTRAGLVDTFLTLTNITAATSGTRMNISFAAANLMRDSARVVTPVPAARFTVNVRDVAAGSAVIATKDISITAATSQAAAWGTYNLKFFVPAGTTQVKLEFVSTVDTADLALDNISVQPFTLPAASATLSAASGTFSGDTAVTICPDGTAVTLAATGTDPDSAFAGVGYVYQWYYNANTSATLASSAWSKVGLATPAATIGTNSFSISPNLNTYGSYVMIVSLAGTAPTPNNINSGSKCGAASNILRIIPPAGIPLVSFVYPDPNAFPPKSPADVFMATGESTERPGNRDIYNMGIGAYLGNGDFYKTVTGLTAGLATDSSWYLYTVDPASGAVVYEKSITVAEDFIVRGISGQPFTNIDSLQGRYLVYKIHTTGTCPVIESNRVQLMELNYTKTETGATAKGNIWSSPEIYLPDTAGNRLTSVNLCDGDTMLPPVIITHTAGTQAGNIYLDRPSDLNDPFWTYDSSIDPWVDSSGNIYRNLTSFPRPLTFADNGHSVGFYASTVYGNTHSDMVLIHIRQKPVPPVGNIQLKATGTGATCTSPYGVITVTTPIGPDFEYSIDGTNFQDDTVFTGVAPGPYTITARTKGGCYTPDTTHVNVAPPIPATPAHTLLKTPTCADLNGMVQIANMDTANYTYTLSGTGIATPRTINEDTIDQLAGNTGYQLLVTNKQTGCTANASFSLPGARAATATDLDITGTTEITSGTSTTLHAATTTVTSPVFNWYTDTTAAPVYTDSVFTTPVLAVSQYYYVSVAGDSVCPAIAQSVFVHIMGTPLPLRFLDFTVQQQSHAVSLNWKVAPGNDLQYFVPQYSNNGTGFTDIAKVNAQKNSGSYNYDYSGSNGDLDGLYLFRIKGVDTRGMAVYTQPIRVSFESVNTVQLTPNPASSYVDLSVNAGQAGTAQMRLVDDKGMQLLSGTYAIQQGVNNIRIDISSLVQGVYIMQLLVNGESNNLKLMKEK